jgi:hypothetical protein
VDHEAAAAEAETLDGQARKALSGSPGRGDRRCRSHALLPVGCRRSRPRSRQALARARACVLTHLVEVAALVTDDVVPTGRAIRGMSLTPSCGLTWLRPRGGRHRRTGWRSRGSARCGGRRWLVGRRRAAAHWLMPGPGLWPALAVSEQAVLDAPSNTTLQLTSRAVTGVARSAG